MLIQGPPGTGKTHTVKGILNVWHLVHYQRFYNSIVAQLVPWEGEANSGQHSANQVWQTRRLSKQDSLPGHC